MAEPKCRAYESRIVVANCRSGFSKRMGSTMCRMASTCQPRGGTQCFWMSATRRQLTTALGTCAASCEGGVSTRPSDKWYDNCYKLWWHLAAGVCGKQQRGWAPESPRQVE
ncbi:hypothetical protein ACLKA6_001259 [Drosophila palustris]